jgi:hypothetical protein
MFGGSDDFCGFLSEFNFTRGEAFNFLLELEGQVTVTVFSSDISEYRPFS